MAKKPVIKDVHLERAMFSSRLLFLVIVLLTLLAILFLRVYKLQVIDFGHYSTLARENRVRLSPMIPSRGLIYDRKGAVLAENRAAFNLEIIPSRVNDLGSTLLRLGKILEISEDKIKKFHRIRRATPSFQSVPLLYNLSDEEVAVFSLEQHRFPGVSVNTRLRRYYPNGSLATHVVGYVGRINSRDQKSLDLRNYRGTTHIGKTGIEKFYETQLHGNTGVRQEEINSSGRYIRTLEEQPPTSGDGLILSLDLGLQKVAFEALSQYESGAVVAMDPRNGEVLAAVSLPTYDPNLFVNGISSKNYTKLQNNPDRPLFNRLVLGQYPPGSTIKPVTALAGLQHQTITSEQKMFAGPFYTLPNASRKYRDWKKNGHGWVDMDKAITQSCDVYFYDLSFKLGIDKLHDTFAQFGLGEVTGIDLIGEKKGLNPSAAWKEKVRGNVWFPGETVIVGIGQGFLLATPMQLASMTSCLARRGVCAKPSLLKSRFAHQPEAEKSSHSEIRIVDNIKSDHWVKVIEPMTHVINAENGTGYRAFKGIRYSAAGKTGTAQVFGLAEDEEYDADRLARRLRDHSLFIGFAPVDDPVIAVAVVVEHGGHGSRAAAPVARQIMDAWLDPGQNKPGSKQEAKK